MTDNILSRYGMGYDPYAWRSNMDAVPPQQPNVLSQGPAPTGYDRVRDTIYNALGGQPRNAWGADKLATAFDVGTLGMATGAYDGAQSLAQTGQPGSLAMAMMPGMKPVGAAAKAATQGVEQAAANTLRLYRGEGRGKDVATGVDWSGGMGDAAKGRWFTTSENEARSAYAGKDGKVYYVDVPNDRTRDLGNSTLFPGEHYILPEDLAASKSLFAPAPSQQQGIRAYRGIDQARPSHGSSDSMWASSHPRVADAYANETYAFENGAVMPVDMKFSNPMTVDARGNHWTNIERNGETLSTEDLARLARKKGHDGLIVNNVIDTNSKKEFQSPATTYAALKPGTTYSPVTKELLYGTAAPAVLGAGLLSDLDTSGTVDQRSRDASLIEILRKYGLLPPAALGAAASQDPAQQ